MSDSENQLRQFVFEAIGTYWVIDVRTFLEESEAQTLLTSIHDVIERCDRHYSRFRADSWVSVVAQNAGEYRIPDDAEPLFTVYRLLYERTNGAFTPLIGQVLEQAGYDAQYSLHASKEMSPTPRWEDVLAVQGDMLRVSQPVMLDFGAAGKGYLVDQVAELFESRGIFEYCIDAGGDMRMASHTGIVQRIGMEHPLNTQQVIGVIEMSTGSICASAGNRRKWGRYHHIIDAQTQVSPRDVVATWVCASEARIADALATCLFFVSPEELKQDFSFEYAIMYDGQRVRTSTDWNGKLFT